MEIFVYGMLLHGPLRRAVLGQEVATRPAHLPDHAVRCAAGSGPPVLVPAPGQAA